MSAVVVDASLAAAILLPDEWTDTVPAVREALSTSALRAPLHWPIEMASLLVKAERRGRVSSAERVAYLGQTMAMLATVRLDDDKPWLAVAELAVVTGLSVYDAAYLELALRCAATLATNDDALAFVARARGVAIISTRR